MVSSILQSRREVRRLALLITSRVSDQCDPVAILMVRVLRENQLSLRDISLSDRIGWKSSRYKTGLFTALHMQIAI